MFEDLFDHIDLGSHAPQRAQTIFRIVFGAIGLFLALAGVAHMLFGVKFAGGGLMFRLAAANTFAFLGFFCAFNVALHKPWRWPGRGLIAGFVLLFVVRIVFGP